MVIIFTNLIIIVTLVRVFHISEYNYWTVFLYSFHGLNIRKMFRFFFLNKLWWLMKSSYFTATRNASDWEVSKKEPALFIRYLSKEGYPLFERTNIQLAHSREPNVWSNAAIKKNHQELISKKGVIFQQENSKMHISFGEQKQNHSNIVAKFVSFFFFFDVFTRNCTYGLSF